MIEVICLFSLVLDCFYICYWFLPLEFSSFGLRLKGSTFFIYYALHENYGCICLLEFARTPLTNLSPWNKIWNVALIGFFFFVYFFRASFPLFLYFMWIFRVFPAMFASLIDGAREWLLDAVKTQYPNLEEENKFKGFSYNYCSKRKIVWHQSKYPLLENERKKEGTSTKDGRFTNLYWPRNFSHSTGILRISKAPQHRNLTRWPFSRRRVLANIAFGFHIGTVSEFGLLLFHCSWKFWDILLKNNDCHIEIRKSIRNVQSFCKGDIIYAGVAILEKIWGKIRVPTQLRSMEPEDRCLPNMGKDDPLQP